MPEDTNTNLGQVEDYSNIVNPAPSGFFSSALDYLQRPLFASAKFFDSFSQDGVGALSAAASEFWNPQQRLTFSDVIRHHYPDFAKAHPIATGMLGLVGDVALDPTTWLTYGAGDALKVTGLVGDAEKTLALSKAGAAKYGELLSEAAPKIVDNADVIKSVDQKMVDLINGIGGDIYHNKGGLQLAGQRVPVLADLVEKVGGVIGNTRIAKMIENSKAFETTAKLFNRDWKLPQEWINARRSIVATKSHIAEDLAGTLSKMGVDLKDEEIKGISEVGWKIDDATQQAQKELEASGGIYTRQMAADLKQKMLDASGLNDKQKAAYATLQQGLKQQGALELEAGLLDHTIHNYFPRIYKNVSDSTHYLDLRDKGLLSTFMGPNQARSFFDIESAKAAGLVPEENALSSYAIRIMEGRRKIANQELNDLAQKIAKNSNGLESAKMIDRLSADIKFIGDSQWPSGLESGMRDLGQFYDRALGAWKGLATTVKPSFGFRQAVSNTLQSFLTSGIKAFKVLDPRVMRDAGGLLLYDKGVFQAGNPAAERLLQMTVTNALGKTFTGQEILDLAKKFGVLKGTNITGEALRTSIEGAIRSARTINKWYGPEYEGLGHFVSGLSKYTNWASHVEDYSRLGLFMNGLRIGHSPLEASRIVDKALFDYSGGLSQFERQVAKRIIPFYSFNRFAIPLVADTLVHNPGRVVALDKVTKEFFSTWNKAAGGDSLSPSERSVLPGYLMEQTSMYEGFDKALGKAVFRTFNNFSPLDMSGSIEYDSQGGLDLAKSLRKMGLAQLTPILKMPLELALDKNFFTDQAISRQGNPKAGKIGNVTPEQFMSNLASIMPLKDFGIIGGLIGKGVGTAVYTPDIVQEGIKKVLGWEDAVDPRTQKRQVYINPYLAYGLQSVIPSLGVLLRANDPERHPYEKVLDTFFGIGTQKVDLQQSAGIQRNKQGEDIRNMQTQIRRALLYGRYDEVDKLRADMQTLMQQIYAERAAINPNDIRGQQPQ